MKIVTTSLAIVVAAFLSLPQEALSKGAGRGASHAHGSKTSSGGSHAVKGYTKKNGTYVAAHRKTGPDKSKANNYSSKGNVNPNTGKEGTKDPNKP
jgi:hypothetical protein